MTHRNLLVRIVNSDRIAKKTSSMNDIYHERQTYTTIHSCVSHIHSHRMRSFVYRARCLLLCIFAIAKQSTESSVHDINVDTVPCVCVHSEENVFFPSCSYSHRTSCGSYVLVARKTDNKTEKTAKTQIHESKKMKTNRCIGMGFRIRSCTQSVRKSWNLIAEGEAKSKERRRRSSSREKKTNATERCK